MVKIKSITEGESIQPDPNHNYTVEDPSIVNSTIMHPIPYNFIDIEFVDGIRVQIEKKQEDNKASIIAKVKAKYQSQQIKNSVMGISPGEDVVV